MMKKARKKMSKKLKTYEFNVWMERRGTIVVRGTDEDQAMQIAQTMVDLHGVAALTTLDPQSHDEIEVLDGPEIISAKEAGK